ncbi:hypothetical protein HPP92_028792, partial [Vanilla planifolia]
RCAVASEGGAIESVYREKVRHRVDLVPSEGKNTHPENGLNQYLKRIKYKLSMTFSRRLHVSKIIGKHTISPALGMIDVESTRFRRIETTQRSEARVLYHSETDEAQLAKTYFELRLSHHVQSKLLSQGIGDNSIAEVTERWDRKPPERIYELNPLG